VGNRATIFINCSRKEADKIRECAKLDHRSLSSYVLNIVMRAVQFEEQQLARFRRNPELNRLPRRPAARPIGPRAAFLLRCSAEEAKQIRAVANLTDRSISGFVLRTLRQSWDVAERLKTKQAKG
jgi:uncharacterized protein (DUF1778 family)